MVVIFYAHTIYKLYKYMSIHEKLAIPLVLLFCWPFRWVNSYVLVLKPPSIFIIYRLYSIAYADTHSHTNEVIKVDAPVFAMDFIRLSCSCLIFTFSQYLVHFLSFHSHFYMFHSVSLLFLLFNLLVFFFHFFLLTLENS